MLINEKEQKIQQIIEEITNKKPEIGQQIKYNITETFRNYKIKKILLISSSYNYFLLQEEGRLNNLFNEWCSFEDERPIKIVHIEKGQESLKLIKNESFDLIIIFNKPEDMPIKDLSKKIKDHTDTAIVLLGNNLKELREVADKNHENIDKIFTWNGDGKIVLSIIQLFEDFKNIEKARSKENVKCILLIEDSIQHYSSYISIISQEICNLSSNIVDDEINLEQKVLRYKRRPYILHADTFEQGNQLYEKYKDNLLCILTDNYMKKDKKNKPAGIEIANNAIEENPQLPVLIQSSEPIQQKWIKSNKIHIVSKNSSGLNNKVKQFVKKSFGPKDFILKDKKGKEIFKVKKMKDFENALKNVDDSCFFNCAKKNEISKWLESLNETELSNKCKLIEDKINKADKLKQELVNLLEDYKYSVSKTAISSFSRNFSDPYVKISRIGDGALGGKARGIAFLAKILSKYINEDMFPKLKITIPRSIVLSTDVFDSFIENNNLFDLDFNHLSDERISKKFLDSDLPATVIGDLRSFVRNAKKPLIVRSSGLLEDSLMQPFAGIYASMLLPNDSWETDIRFQEVCNAIKYVFASTYFEKARTYIKSTPKHIGDEKMSVLIQEVVGARNGKYFYPTVSGVAKSYNYYPSGPCKSEEGIVYLALGLGKSIVDGGSSYAFCPERPKAPLFGTAKEYMKYAQNKFYALNLRSIYKFVDYDEDTSLEKLDVEVAKQHGVLDKVVSTYIMQDDSFYPGIYENGYLVVDFSPIINYDSIPLANAIKLLLKISEIALGYPVEIEFAVNIQKDETPSELVILQIRNMIPPEEKIDVEIDDIPKKEILFFSENSLGNGISKNLTDIVYVNQENFDMSKSYQIVEEIKKLNSKLMEEKNPYILIGPGRWGSSDPWLGIPVIWSNIAGAKVIVETPYKERHIDPSQGSHFFHDMIASQVGYIITKKSEDINWDWIIKQKIVEETELIKHIKTNVKLEAIIDGKTGKAVIKRES